MQKSQILGLMALSAFAVPVGMSAESYPINYSKDTTIDTSNRSLNAVVLSSPSDGKQSIAVGQANDRLLYHEDLTKCFSAIIGETVTASFDWTGNWMHGYVYLDRANDGAFSCELGENSAIPDGSDVMTFSNYNGYNSVGTNTANGNVGVNPPAFTIPANLTPGFYRMRYKVDWNSIDPGGNDANGAIHQQLITANNGAITDVMIYLHNAESGFDIQAEHGNVTTTDGTSLDNIEITSGQPLDIKFIADDGYQLSSVTVNSGYTKPESDMEFVSSAFASKNMMIPAFLIQDNAYTIPGEFMHGKVTIKATFVESGDEPSEGNYESNVTGTKGETEGFTSLAITAGDETTTLNIATTQRHYFDETTLVSVVKGSIITPVVNYTGTASDIKLYVDLNQNGVFTEGAVYELMTSAAVGETLPSFSITDLLPTGVYRCRLAAGDDCAVDFLMSIHEAQGTVDVNIMNGYAVGNAGALLPNNVTFGQSMKVLVKPTLPGFDAEEATVRHGQNLNGPQYIRGNRQWEEITIPTDQISDIPAVNGDILITADFIQAEDSEWAYIWGDEFNGDKLDTTKWSFHPRWGESTWNRFVAIGDEAISHVNKFENGHYVAHSIATPEECLAANGNRDMITGAIYSSGKFNLIGGYIEARVKTTAHAGNFPAFWMMPQSSKYSWPVCGEIDIWEQINTENISYHTIHSGWTKKSYGNVSQSSPQSSGTTQCDHTKWHIYALEWDPEYLKFYVDNKLAFTYKNMHFTEGQYKEDITWPFNNYFYLILNQSVGDGSWATRPDLAFKYTTEFDYVRTYQKKGAFEYYSTADGHVSGIEDVTIDENENDEDAPVVYYNLQGVRIDTPNLAKGIYIRQQGKNVSKVFVR